MIFLSHKRGQPSYKRHNILRLHEREGGMCTFSCRVSKSVGGVPSRVEDCYSDVIASSTPQTSNCVAVLVFWESSTSSSLSISYSSSSRLPC